MDAMLTEITQTIDFDTRKALVAEMLDHAMDLVIEFPVYQRKNMFAYNTTYLDMSTIPENITPFYDYENVLWQISVKD